MRPLRVVVRVGGERHEGAGAGGGPANRTLSRILFGMQSEAVSLAVAHESTESVRANGVDILKNFTSLSLDLGDGVADAAMHIQVKEDASVTMDGIGHGHQTPAISRFVHQHSKGESIEGFRADWDVEECLIEVDGACEVGDWDVEPNGAVVVSVEVAHGFGPCS